MSATSQRRENKQGRKTLRIQRDSAFQAYYRSNSYEAKKNALSAIVRESGIKLGHLTLSQSQLELATLAPDSEKDAHIESSVEHAHLAEQIAIKPQDRIRSVMHLANLPLQLLIHIERSHPTLDMLRIAQYRLATTLRDTPTNLVGNPNGPETIGAASEAAALLFLQRYATEKIGCEGYSPVPSLTSQDNTSHGSKYAQKNWDISVFTEPDIEPSNPQYKIQIKFNADPTTYIDDIALISLKNMVILGRPSPTYTSLVTFAASSILEPSELYLNKGADSYTEAMLDIMG